VASPTVQTTDTKNGTVTSNSASWTLTYPTNLASGDLILAFVASDGDNNMTFPAGWTQNFIGSSSAVTLNFAKKLSNGTETGTFSVTGASEQGGWRVFRITDWEGTIGTIFSNLAASGSVVEEATNGSSSTPDPPSLDPVNWATEDTLWFAACGVDTSRTISVYPLADNNTADVSGGSGGATLGLCSTNSAVSSLDPGTFTISASDDWAAVTVAVRPAAAAVEITPDRPLLMRLSIP
jgi:hypothetical protein